MSEIDTDHGFSYDDLFKMLCVLIEVKHAGKVTFGVDELRNARAAQPGALFGIRITNTSNTFKEKKIVEVYEVTPDEDVTVPCPTCTGQIRETVGLVCQTCGTDYGASSPTRSKKGALIKVEYPDNTDRN